MNAVPELFLKHKSFQPISHPPEGQNIPVAADLHGAIGNTTRNCSGLSLNVAILAALSGFLEEKGISSFLVAHLFFFFPWQWDALSPLVYAAASSVGCFASWRKLPAAKNACVRIVTVGRN